MRCLAAPCALLLCLGAAAPARGNGAFPDSLALLLPEDRPDEIDLVTNFGLLITRNGGASWFWVCEEAVGPGVVNLYQVAPSPDDTLIAAGSRGLFTSTDACQWTAAGGALGGGFTTIDAFIDPGNARHVVALAYVPRDGGLDSALVASHDGGKSFGPPLLVAPEDLQLSSLEIPAGAPERLYVTLYAGRDLHPWLARSTDGGMSFRWVDELAELGPAVPRIATISPVNPQGLQRPQRLYLRAQGQEVDTLVISTDGGDHFRTALAPGGRLTAFLRRADGTLLAGDAKGRGYRSHDDGQHFEDWPTGLHLRALAERGGRLYAAASDLRDPFAVGVSDDGEHFRPLLRYADVCGWLPCAPVAAACAPNWRILAATLGITGAPGCPGPDAGTPSARPAALPETGCGCHLRRREPPAASTAMAAAVALLVVMAARRGGKSAGHRRTGGRTSPVQQ